MSLNHAVALTLVLHLECVGKGGNKREIVYLLLMDLLHVKYMSSSKFSASYPRHTAQWAHYWCKNITSNKMATPKIWPCGKKEFLLSIIVHIQKFGKQIILQKLHLHYQKVTVSLPFSLIKSLHICAPDLIFTSNYKYTWTGTYACILHNSGILLVDNAFENDHIVHLIHAYKHTCKLYTVVNLWP